MSAAAARIERRLRRPKHAILLSLVALIGANSVRAAEPNWAELIGARHPELLLCQLPAALEGKRLPLPLDDMGAQVALAIDWGTADGCTVRVYSIAETDEVVLVVHRGLDDRPTFALGPFALDGRDF